MPTARTPFVSQPNASSSSANPSHAPNSNSPMSPELEQTLLVLSSHRSVLGYMLITRGHHPSIIRHSGVVFEGEQGKRYAAVVARIVESVQSGLEEVRADDGLSAATGDVDVVCLFFCPICSWPEVFGRMKLGSCEYEQKDTKLWSHLVRS